MLDSKFFSNTIESAINHLLSFDAVTQARLAAINNKTVSIELTDLNFVLHAQIIDNHIKFIHADNFNSDCLIKGTLATLFNQSKVFPFKIPGKQQISIEGDTDLGITIKDILQKIDIDWESTLASFTGTTSAHLAFQAAGKVKNIGGEILQGFSDNFHEYMEEESGVIPTKYELDVFYADVDKLKHAISRCEQRVAKLDLYLSEK